MKRDAARATQQAKGRTPVLTESESPVREFLDQLSASNVFKPNTIEALEAGGISLQEASTKGTVTGASTGSHHPLVCTNGVHP